MASLLKNNALIAKSRLKGLLFYLCGRYAAAKSFIVLQNAKLSYCDI